MTPLRAHHAPVFHHYHHVHESHNFHSVHWMIDHPRIAGFMLACLVALVLITLASVVDIGIKSGAWQLWAP